MLPDKAQPDTATSSDSEPFDAKAFLQTLTHRPGVYRMLDEEGTVIYVGKARDLKKRVASYFGSKAHHPKTMALMERARLVEATLEVDRAVGREPGPLLHE